MNIGVRDKSRLIHSNHCCHARPIECVMHTPNAAINKPVGHVSAPCVTATKERCQLVMVGFGVTFSAPHPRAGRGSLFTALFGSRDLRNRGYRRRALECRTSLFQCGSSELQQVSLSAVMSAQTADRG